MPNRIISDVTWKSKKLRVVQPPEFRPEYAWIMPIVEDNGCFEYDPETIWAEAYAVARPSVDVAKVKAILDEFIRVGLLLKYEVEGRNYCYLVGCDKPGHLPAPTKRYSTIPLPPADAATRRPTRPDAASGLDLDSDKDLEAGKDMDSEAEAAEAKPNPLSVEDIEDPEMLTLAVGRPESKTITAREPKSGEHAQWLTVYFWELVGSPKQVVRDLKHQWEPKMAHLLRSHVFEELRGLIRWAIKEDTFWPKLVTNPEKLTKHIDKLSEQFRAWQQLKQNQKKAAEKEQVASSAKKQAPANYGGGEIVPLRGEKLL
jgi:hypothetical protein